MASSRDSRGGKGPGGFLEEDRARDWHCANMKCRERNFAKRSECYKCGTRRPPEGQEAAPPKPPPQNGTTLAGMVKSYNKKGFGFIMCFGQEVCQDIYFTRESVSSRLLHPDMPGEHVHFEIHREGRKMIAKNIRPLGEDKNVAMSAGLGKDNSKGKVFARGYQEEDRSRDWTCSACQERNFVKRFECFKCKSARPQGFSEAVPAVSTPSAPRRTFSPHAGARAIREALAAGPDSGRSRSRTRKRKKKKERKKKKRRSRSRSTGSVSTSEQSKKKQRSKRNRSSSSASSRMNRSKRRHSKTRSSSSSVMVAEPSERKAAADLLSSDNPEIEKAKSEALQELMKLRSVQPMEARMTEWRTLLRKWHPDKNLDRVDVATIVFQFLQKGKRLLHAN